MYRTPSLLRQRQDRGAAHAGQDDDRFLEFLRREVHQHVFHAPAFEDGVEAEGELCRFTALRLVHFRVGDQHRLGIKDLLDFDQPVRDERAARRYDVEDRIGHPDRRGDLHGTLDGVYFGVDALFGEEPREDVGVGGGDALAAEIIQPFVCHRAFHGQRDAAVPEPEIHRLLYAESFLRHFVQPHDAQVGDAHRHGLRDVVVAQVEHFQREAPGARDEFAFAFGDADARLGEQFDALFVESALGLDCDSQHFCLVFGTPPAA